MSFMRVFVFVPIVLVVVYLVMSKGNGKKRSRKNKIKNEIVPSISRRQVSSNWLNYMKSEGLSEKSFYNRKVDTKIPVDGLKKSTTKSPAITKVLSLDCEMVADLSDQDMLARVSIVNFQLECIYDKYVKPTAKVGDYRTRFSGIREKDLSEGADFETVREEVRNIIHSKILVGHALHNDFRALKFGHHGRLIRDTAKYIPFREACSTNSPSLKTLAKVFLNENIQEGEHSSVEDAKTAMKLYRMFKKEWEKSLIKSKPCEKNESTLMMSY